MSAKGSITTADYLPYDDYQRLVQTLIDEEQYWWATYCILSFCTGLRFSDVSRLKWSDVLDKSKIVIVAKKTKKTHAITIGENAAQHFKDLYRKLGYQTKDRLILSSPSCVLGDKPVSIQYINRTLAKWKDKYNLDIENFHTHTFRKTFGRYVYEKGGCDERTLVYLNRIFKHTSLDTTMVYLGIRDDEIASIFKSIEI